MQPKVHAVEENYKKGVSYILPHFPFRSYSYVKSHLDNDSCLPIYKMIPVICNTPCQTQCVVNSNFPHFVMVIMVLRAVLWIVVVCQALCFFKES